MGDEEHGLPSLPKIRKLRIHVVARQRVSLGLVHEQQRRIGGDQGRRGRWRRCCMLRSSQGSRFSIRPAPQAHELQRARSR